MGLWSSCVEADRWLKVHTIPCGTFIKPTFRTCCVMMKCGKKPLAKLRLHEASSGARCVGPFHLAPANDRHCRGARIVIG